MFDQPWWLHGTGVWVHSIDRCSRRLLSDALVWKNHFCYWLYHRHESLPSTLDARSLCSNVYFQSIPLSWAIYSIQTLGRWYAAPPRLLIFPRLRINERVGGGGIMRDSNNTQHLQDDLWYTSRRSKSSTTNYHTRDITTRVIRQG